MKKKRSLSYYATKVIYCERAEAQSENYIIRMIWKVLKLYYSNKWERWYD